MLRRVLWYKLINVSEVLTAFVIALTMEAGNTSEMSVNFNQTTRRDMAEDIYRTGNLTRKKPCVRSTFNTNVQPVA
jgi:phage head maturation protease